MFRAGLLLISRRMKSV